MLEISEYWEEKLGAAGGGLILAVFSLSLIGWHADKMDSIIDLVNGEYLTPHVVVIMGLLGFALVLSVYVKLFVKEAKGVDFAALAPGALLNGASIVLTLCLAFVITYFLTVFGAFPFEVESEIGMSVTAVSLALIWWFALSAKFIKDNIFTSILLFSVVSGSSFVFIKWVAMAVPA